MMALRTVTMAADVVKPYVNEKILDCIWHNDVEHATATFLISKVFCTILALISRNAFLISKNRLFLAND